MKIVKKIKFPDSEFFENLVLETEENKKNINKLFEKMNFENENELMGEIEDLEKKYMDFLSLNALIKYFDSFIERKSKQQYDITKIHISNKNNEILKENDRNVLRVMDFFTETGIEKEVGMYHFIYGLTQDLDNNDIEILFEEGFLKNKEE